MENGQGAMTDIQPAEEGLLFQDEVIQAFGLHGIEDIAAFRDLEYCGNEQRAGHWCS